MTHHITWVIGFLLLAGCSSTAQTVRPGIDVLLTDSAHLVAGRRTAILTNQTGVDAAGTSDVDRLVAAGVQLAAIFSPEHGYRGVLDQENIGHGADSATGVPVWSLYGDVRAPTAEMLEGVDVLVVDLQDIGARTYTYISTILLTMQSARTHGVPVIVLDRPNPIGGVQMQGPVLDTAFSSFVGMLPVPLRHGMTMGELARFGNEVLGIGAELAVVPAVGWTRSQWFDHTALPWVRPSPNMPDLESATHYPGTVLFEGTNLSVGRGTPIAFQVIGAPWLDPAAVLGRVAAPAGVEFGDTMIAPVRPPDGKYEGLTIPAVRLRVTDRGTYDPVGAAVHLLTAIRGTHPGSFALRADGFDRLAGGTRLRRQIESGVPPDSIVVGWDAALRAFRELRRRYLLYPH